MLPYLSRGNVSLVICRRRDASTFAKASAFAEASADEMAGKPSAAAIFDGLAGAGTFAKSVKKG